MAKGRKTLDESSLRAMADLATSSSDLSKLQENLGWSTLEMKEEPVSDPIKLEESQEPSQSVDSDQPVDQVTPPVETPVKASKESVSNAASEKKVEKYSNNYLQPIKGFDRPTKVAYISKRSHSYVSFLQRYAELTGSKVSLQEIMENIFRQHFTENRAEIETMRTTLEQKEAQLREW
jgi:trehalose-6-phosphate synthase